MRPYLQKQGHDMSGNVARVISLMLVENQEFSVLLGKQLEVGRGGTAMPGTLVSLSPAPQGHWLDGLPDPHTKQGGCAGQSGGSSSTTVASLPPFGGKVYTASPHSLSPETFFSS